MSDTATGAQGEGTPAPATPPTPAPKPAAPAAPAPSPPAAAAPKDGDEPHWLKPRLEQAERAAEKRLLDALGVSDPKEIEEAKNALAAVRKRAEEEKTLEQRLAEIEAAQKQAMTEAERLKATATEHAARMLGVLTEEQQAAVKAIAGDDPAAQLKAITALGPTWAAQAQAAAPATQPVTTAPPKDAPGEAHTESPPDPVAHYQRLRQTNPFAAAAYGMSNPGVYTPKQQ